MAMLGQEAIAHLGLTKMLREQCDFVRCVSRGGRGGRRKNKLSVLWNILVAKITIFSIYSPCSLDDDLTFSRCSYQDLHCSIALKSVPLILHRLELFLVPFGSKWQGF